MSESPQVDAPEVTIARYALWVSMAALAVSAGAFSLELRRWIESGVKLSMTVMSDAMLFGGIADDENTYVSVTVTNRGDAPTTITHMLFYNYPKRLARYMPRQLARHWKSQSPKIMLVVNTGNPGPLPFHLEPGKNWVGLAAHTPDLEHMIAAGNLYLGIIGSHSDQTLFKRVRRWKPPKGTETLSAT
jgi:hypothetical protein